MSQKLDGVLAPLFARYGDYYFNFADGAALGATDEDFFDGWHASEQDQPAAYTSRCSRRCRTCWVQYSDPAALQAADDGATDTFDVFGNRTT